MSDTRQNRFEIDLEEIERQLRRSVEESAPPAAPSVAPPSGAPAGVPQRAAGAPSPAASDPLAELARIVGQDDPFRGILGDRPQPAKAPPAPTGRTPERIEPTTSETLDVDPPLTREDREILGGPGAPDIDPPSRGRDGYDPVSTAYGSLDDAVEEREFVPLEPRRSRGRLMTVLVVLALVVAGAAGAFFWRKGGTNYASNGAPPVIRPDNAPTKLAPENPGGVDIPNQNRQIYERGAPDPKSRVVDRQEQPIDVREVARTLPGPAPATTAPSTTAPTSSAPGQSAGGPNGSAPGSSPGRGDAPATTSLSASVSGARPPNAVTSALGEPRRIRTVTVRPDGSVVPPGTPSTADSAPVFGTPSSLPPPVPVATVSIPVNQPPAATAPSATPSSAAVPPSSTPPVSVLPPARPQVASAAPVSVPSEAAPIAEAPAPIAGADGTPPPGAVAVNVRPPARPAGLAAQTASVAEPAPSPADATATSFVVQIATRNTEPEAQAAYTQLADKFATDLGGKPAFVAQGDVRGKAVYRVRVGPMSRAEANTLCTRLKSSGGACLVTAE